MYFQQESSLYIPQLQKWCCVLLQEGPGVVVLVEDANLAFGESVCDVVLVHSQQLPKLIAGSCGYPGDGASLKHHTF